MAYDSLAGLLIRLGRKEEAADIYERGLKVTPKDPKRWYGAAALYLSIGDVDRYRGACRELLDFAEKLSENNPGSRLCCQSLAVWLLALVATCLAANRRWATGNGTFSVATNWQGGFVPGPGDVAQYGRSDSSSLFQFVYTVSLSANATNQALHIEDDIVTFDLNGRLYSVTAANGIVVGNQTRGSIHSGALTLMDGIVGSATNIDVGAAAGASGSLAVREGGWISGSPTITIGKFGTGSLLIQSSTVEARVETTGLTEIAANSGVTGTATISGINAKLITNTLAVGSNGNGTVNITAGGFLTSASTAIVGSGSFFTGVGTGTVNIGSSSSW